VHVQYEPGLYGLKLDMFNPAKTSTDADSFYKSCKVPIITTFHSTYPFRQWTSLPIPIYELPQDHYLVKRSKRMISDWTRLINYRSFHRLNTQKLAQSAAGIVFSGITMINFYFLNIIHLTYSLHASEPKVKLAKVTRILNIKT
jgi:hypothetical protein